MPPELDGFECPVAAAADEDVASGGGAG